MKTSCHTETQSLPIKTRSQYSLVMLIFGLLLLSLPSPLFSKMHGRDYSPPPKPAIPHAVLNPATGMISHNHRLNYHASPKQHRKKKPKALIIYRTQTKTFFEAHAAMERDRRSVHILIDIDGRLYQLMDSLMENARWSTLPEIDENAIHISLVGRHEHDVLANFYQIETLTKTLRILSTIYKIPRTNQHVEKQHGIFSGCQITMRFGGTACASVCKTLSNHNNPGELIMETVLNSLNDGYYTSYYQWENRCKKRWRIAEETCQRVPHEPRTKGRGRTAPPRPSLSFVKTDNQGHIVEKGRLRYPYKGIIKKIECINIINTGKNTLKDSQNTIEAQGDGAHLIIDINGNTYQAYDKINEKIPNNECINIRIISDNKSSLTPNKNQIPPLIKSIKEISTIYNIKNIHKNSPHRTEKTIQCSNKKTKTEHIRQNNTNHEIYKTFNPIFTSQKEEKTNTLIKKTDKWLDINSSHPKNDYNNKCLDPEYLFYNPQ